MKTFASLVQTPVSYTHLLTVPDGGKPLLNYVRRATVKNLNLYGTHIRGYGLVDKYVVDYEGVTDYMLRTADVYKRQVINNAVTFDKEIENLFMNHGVSKEDLDIIENEVSHIHDMIEEITSKSKIEPK